VFQVEFDSLVFIIYLTYNHSHPFCTHSEEYRLIVGINRLMKMGNITDNIFNPLNIYYQNLLILAQEGRIIGVERIVEAFKIAPLISSTVHCIAHIADSYAASLSLSFVHGEVIYYKNLESLKNYLRNERILLNRAATGYHATSYQHYTILIKLPSDCGYTKDQINNLINIVGNICEVVYSHSLQLRNIERDIYNKKFRILESEMNKNSSYSLNDLCNFIRSHEDVSVIHLYISDLAHELRPDPTQLVLNKDKINKKIIDIRSQDFVDTIRGNYLEAIRTGKSISGTISEDDNVCYYVLIPVLRRNESPRHVTRLLLVYEYEPLFSRKIDFINDYVDYFVSHTGLDRKLRELISVQEEVLNIPMLIARNQIGRYSDFAEIFRKFISSRLSQVLNTTSAHSAVVRLYYPELKGLKVFTADSKDRGQYDYNKVEEINIIPLTLRRTSVNAFIFLDGAKRYDYVYLPNMRKPIPSPYNDGGLDHWLKTRESSLSEICFPLLAGGMPFGTLNIESEVIDAFGENDIRYLQALQEAIEAYYGNTWHTNDIQWLRGQIDRYENIHELKNYHTLGLLDGHMKELVERFLMTSINERVQLIGSNILDLQSRLFEWISLIYHDLSNDNLRKIKSILKFKLDDIDIPFDRMESIIVILKNLIRNAERYGDLRRNEITISTRPFYGIDYHNSIRIFMKIYGAFESETLERIGIAPIADSKGTHFGMFLVGMLTRILGGTLLVSREVDKLEHVIEIRIPLLGGEHGNN